MQALFGSNLKTILSLRRSSLTQPRGVDEFQWLQEHIGMIIGILLPGIQKKEMHQSPPD